MSFQVDVLTMGGSVMKVKAEDWWTVWKFKCAVEEQSGTQPNLQRLINPEGVELSEERLLRDFLPEGMDPVQLFLAKMQKSQSELEWLQRWSEVTPDWLQRFSREILDYPSNPSLPRSRPESPHCHPTRVLKTCVEDPKAEVLPQPIMKTSTEVLSAAKKTESGRRYLDMMDIQGSTVTLQWSRFAGDASKFERKATLDAVVDAFVQEPHAMVDYLVNCDMVNLVLAALPRCPDIFHSLPDYLQEDRAILYAAVELDPELKAEFLRTADRKELRQWQKHQWLW